MTAAQDSAPAPQLDAAALRGEVDRLLADNARLAAQLREVLDLVGELRGTVEKHTAHIAKLVRLAFGRRSERVDGPTLFDGLPDEAPPAPTPAAEAQPPAGGAPAGGAPSRPGRKGHGRSRNPVELPRRREEVDLTEAEKVCPCCSAARTRVGETVRERLDYTPASVFVRLISRPTYACRTCELAARDPQFVRPEIPPEPVPKSGVGAGLLAHVVVSKYVDHLPLYRQEAIFARHGWPVSRARLCDLLAPTAVLLDPVYRAMLARLKGSFAIHADETPVRLLRPGRAAYAWVYLGDAANPYTAVDVTPGRGEEYPAALLGGFTGFVHADGYAGYNAVHGGGIRHLACWAHVRRKFVEARENTPAKASEALAYVRTLYAVEKEVTDGNLVGAAVAALRQARAGPILARFGEWLSAEGRSALPKSPFGQAVSYACNQWPPLGRYLSDARFSIDNNVAERAVRPLAVGRRNWLFIGGDGGLRTASVLMSVCASARRHGLEPWSYLTDVLGRLAAGPSDVGQLLPDVWAKSVAAGGQKVCA